MDERVFKTFKIYKGKEWILYKFSVIRQNKGTEYWSNKGQW